jgi:hypothetical protein
MSETVETNGLTFDAVVKELFNRKHAERPGWKEQGKYVCIMPGMQHIWQIMTIPNPNAGNWLPLAEDFCATDWTVS